MTSADRCCGSGVGELSEDCGSGLAVREVVIFSLDAFGGVADHETHERRQRHGSATSGSDSTQRAAARRRAACRSGGADSWVGHEADAQGAGRTDGWCVMGEERDVLGVLARRAFGDGATVEIVERGDGVGFTIVAPDGGRYSHEPSCESRARAEMVAGALLQAVWESRVSP